MAIYSEIVQALAWSPDAPGFTWRVRRSGLDNSAFAEESTALFGSTITHTLSKDYADGSGHFSVSHQISGVYVHHNAGSASTSLLGDTGGGHYSASSYGSATADGARTGVHRWMEDGSTTFHESTSYTDGVYAGTLSEWTREGKATRSQSQHFVEASMSTRTEAIAWDTTVGLIGGGGEEEEEDEGDDPDPYYTYSGNRPLRIDVDSGGDIVYSSTRGYKLTETTPVSWGTATTHDRYVSVTSNYHTRHTEDTSSSGHYSPPGVSRTASSSGSYVTSHKWDNSGASLIHSSRTSSTTADLAGYPIEGPYTTNDPGSWASAASEFSNAFNEEAVFAGVDRPLAEIAFHPNWNLVMSFNTTHGDLFMPKTPGQMLLANLIAPKGPGQGDEFDRWLDKGKLYIAELLGLRESDKNPAKIQGDNQAPKAASDAGNPVNGPQSKTTSPNTDKTTGQNGPKSNQQNPSDQGGAISADDSPGMSLREALESQIREYQKKLKSRKLSRAERSELERNLQGAQGDLQKLDDDEAARTPQVPVESTDAANKERLAPGSANDNRKWRADADLARKLIGVIPFGGFLLKGQAWLVDKVGLGERISNNVEMHEIADAQMKQDILNWLSVQCSLVGLTIRVVEGTEGLFMIIEGEDPATGVMKAMIAFLPFCFAAGTQVLTVAKDAASSSIVGSAKFNSAAEDKWAIAPSAAVAESPALEYRAIETLKAGDWVWSWNEVTGDCEPCRIVETYENTCDHLLHLTVRGEDGKEQTLKTTLPHPFWVPDQGWTSAGKLQPGDQLVGHEGECLTVVESTLAVHPAGVKVYNFQVDRLPNYFVAAALNLPAILAHNSAGAKCDETEGRNAARIKESTRQAPRFRDKVDGHVAGAKPSQRDLGELPTKPSSETLRSARLGQIAERNGFRKTNFKSHGQPVYTNGTTFITPDVDSHSGGAFKAADSVENLGSKKTRLGTFDEQFRWIGD